MSIPTIYSTRLNFLLPNGNLIMPFLTEHSILLSGKDGDESQYFELVWSNEDFFCRGQLCHLAQRAIVIDK